MVLDSLEIMKEYSSDLAESEERIDIVNYKLSIVCYLIEEITNKVEERTDSKAQDKGKRIKVENKKDTDAILFYEQIQKLLSSSGNEAYTVENIKREEALGNAEGLINIDILRDYLPLLNQIKTSQEGEILMLKDKLKGQSVGNRNKI